MVGVWQGKFDDQPSLILTLAEDTGKTLEGAPVMNILSRDSGQPHVVAREPHVLVRPRVGGLFHFS